MEPSLPEAIRVTFQVVDGLERLQIPYAIVGSLASAVHGLARATMDVDLIVEMDTAQVQPLVDALLPDFYIDEQMAYSAVQQRGSFNLIHRDTFFKVDFFVQGEGSFDRVQMERRENFQLVPDEKRLVSIASPEDTVLAKLAWYRKGGEVSERQWRDIIGVITFQADSLDVGYLRHWAANLGIADLIEKALMDGKNFD